MDQTVGTAKCKHQSTTHSHTKPLIQVSRIEKKRGQKAVLAEPNEGFDFRLSSIKFYFDGFDSLHITRAPPRV
jgi:hypothetical protein